MTATVTLIPLNTKPTTYLGSLRTMPPGVLLSFPGRAAGTFTPEMRRSLASAVSGMPSMHPVVFDVDADGAEVCRLSDHLVIGRDSNHKLFVRDMRSGFVDHGPFRNVDEICRLIASFED